MSYAHRFDGHQQRRDSPQRLPPQNHPQVPSGWIDEPPKPWYFHELDALFNSRDPLFQDRLYFPHNTIKTLMFTISKLSLISQRV